MIETPDYSHRVTVCSDMQFGCPVFRELKIIDERTAGCLRPQPILPKAGDIHVGKRSHLEGWK